MKDEPATKRFYDLVWPQRAVLLRVARILTANQAEAEDLSQETLFKAFRKLESFREGTDVRAWLLAILRNTRIDRLRSRASEPGLSLSDAIVEPASPATDESTADWQNPQELLNAFSDQQVIDALQQLPEEIRWTLLLVDVESLSLQEAAELLEVPVGTIKSRAHRGRAMLREALLPVARDRRLIRD